MSTVIENFYVLPLSSMEEVNENLSKMRAAVKKIARKKAIAAMANDFLCYHFLNKEPKPGTYLQMHYEDYNNQDIFSLYEQKYAEEDTFLYVFLNLARLSEQLSCGGRLDYSTTIYFKTQGDKTFFTFYNKTYQKELIKELKKEFNLKRYDYWDNADRPSGVSAAEWNQRRDEYEELSRDGYRLSDFMYASTCKIADSLNIGLYDSLKKEFPSSLAIKTFIFAHQEMNRIFEEQKEAGKVTSQSVRESLLKVRLKTRKEEINQIVVDRSSLIQSLIKDRVEVF